MPSEDPSFYTPGSPDWHPSLFGFLLVMMTICWNIPRIEREGGAGVVGTATRDGCQFRCLWQLSKRVMQVGVNIAWGEVWLDSSSTGGKRERGERDGKKGKRHNGGRGMEGFEEAKMRGCRFVRGYFHLTKFRMINKKCGSRHPIKYCNKYKLSFYGCMAMPDWECVRWLVVEIVWWRNISM